jgi:hypothetical protein
MVRYENVFASCYIPTNTNHPYKPQLDKLNINALGSDLYLHDSNFNGLFRPSLFEWILDTTLNIVQNLLILHCQMNQSLNL